MKESMEPVKIAIIGAGKVGSAAAYSLLLSGLAAEIVLVDINRTKAEGEAMDLEHAMPFSHPTQIWAGTYADCADAEIVIVAAGATEQVKESRLELTSRNARIFRQIIPEVARHAPNATLLVASNPVDVLTYLSWKLSGFPPNRVIGSGTVCDTARLRYLLGQRFGIDPQSVHAYIIGEHGDCEVPVWSLANVAGMALRDFCEHEQGEYDQREMEMIFEQTKAATDEIIRRKGATYYPIGAGLVRIVEAIVRDENTLLTVSSLAAHYGINEVCLSLPTKINRNGADHILQLPLNQEELSRLVKAGENVKAAVAELGLDISQDAGLTLAKETRQGSALHERALNVKNTRKEKVNEAPH